MLFPCWGGTELARSLASGVFWGKIQAMATRLVLVPRSEGEWEADVGMPPQFAGELRGGRVRVYSPGALNAAAMLYRPHQLAFNAADGKMRITVVGNAARPTELVTADRATILAPTAGALARYRNGFRLLNADNQGHLCDYVAPASRDRGSVWPDWRFALEERGFTLFQKGTIAPAEEPEIAVLNRSAARYPDGGSLNGWLNPLVIALRDDVLAPGFDGDPSIGTPIGVTVDGASEKGLIPELDMRTARRAVAWRAVWGYGISRPSCLAALFDPARPHREQSQRAGREFDVADYTRLFGAPLAELAALDSMGGSFLATRESRSGVLKWGWRPGRALSEADQQLARYLTSGLALEYQEYQESGEPLPEVLSWQLEAGWRRRKIVPLERPSGSGVGGHLRAAADDKKLRECAPFLQVLAERLLKDAVHLVAGEALLEPLIAGAFASNGEYGIDPEAALDVFVEQFFVPQSPILVQMDGSVRCNMNASDSSDFDMHYRAKAIDLFKSAGGKVDTLYAAAPYFQRVDVPDATEYRSGWWGAFWLHCVAGDGRKSFRLSSRDRRFSLDVSRLNNAYLQ